MVADIDPHVIGITESWANEDIVDAELALTGYVVFRKDLTRFNKIAISNNKFQMASGQGSHWLIESPTIFSSMCSLPLSDICQFYFKHIHTTSINTIISISLLHHYLYHGLLV